MYTAFHGLREKPFSLTPDPRFLFLAESPREALAHLLYGIEQGEGFIAITGEVGTGKTTLCRTLIQRLGAETEVAYVFDPKLSALELLQAIQVELGLAGTGSSWRTLSEELNRFLVEKHREGRRVLLIVDEAQNLERETLEQIRLLSNLETETSKLIQIVLIGQPELDAKLETPELRQLRQRISVRWRLRPLSVDETAEYVSHRLRVAAGVERALFSAPALREVHRRSSGVPRVVNVICDRALLAAYAAGSHEVGPELVRQAAREMEAGARAEESQGARAWLARRVAPIAAALGGAAAAALAAFALVGTRAPEPVWEAEVALAGIPVATEPAPPAEVPAAPPAEVPATPPAEVSAAPLAEVSAAPPGETADAVHASVSPESAAPAPAAGEPAAPPVAAVEPAPPPEPAFSNAPPEATVVGAVDAVLARWSEPALGADALPLAAALRALEERGFSVLAVNDSNLDALAHLGYPTLLRLDQAETGGRLVLLEGLEGDLVTLAGVGGTARLARSELITRWSGEALVLWRDFEGLSDTLRSGAEGREVKWLQSALAELGFLARETTGRFDVHTLAAVLAFQQTNALEADGAVGPRTKMALYAALPRYPVPRPTRDTRSARAGGQAG